jgi:putative ABC transport system permease protein
MNEQGFEIIAADNDKPWQHWQSHQTLLISEPLSTKHALEPGDILEVFTENSGFQAFSIAAVFRDFGSSHGKLLMSRAIFDQHWHEPGISSLGIMLDDSADDTDIVNTIRQQLSSAELPLLVQSNTAIRQQSLAVFDRTFEVTRVLRWLTVGVAFVGFLSAREFAVLRASGATRVRVMRLIIIQTLVMGLLAGALALPLGWLMSEVLIKVINVRSFGWSMQSMIPPGSVSGTFLLACLSALLAGLYPAFRLSRSQIAAQLRDD